MSDAVDFLYADKHGSLLQIDTKIIWWVWWSSIPKVSLETLQVCNVFTISLNKLEMKLSFLKTSKFPTSWFQHFGHKSFLQCDRHDHENVKRMVMGMIKYSQSAQSNKFAVSLQYL